MPAEHARTLNRKLKPQGLRNCSGCSTTLPLTAFWSSRTGHQTYCKTCSVRHRKTNYVRHRDANPSIRILAAARDRAAKRGIDFSLTLKDIVVPLTCPVLGIPLFVKTGTHGGKDNSPSLDRIDNDAGYVPGNVIVVSWRANRLKNNSTPNELRRIADFYENLT